MTDNDFKAFSFEYNRTAVAVDAEVRAEKLDIFFEELRDLPLEAVVLAMRECVRAGSRWFPGIPEIRKAAISTDDLTAGEAWAEIEGHIMDCAGTSRQPAFSTPRVASACAAVGGIDGIWMAGTDQKGMYRAQFTKAYESSCVRDAKRQMIGRDEAKLVLADLHREIEKRKEGVA